MGSKHIKSGIIGVANFSPLDFDFYVDKNISRTVNVDEKCDIFYTKEVKQNKSKLQIVFNDIEYLQKNNIKVVDQKIKEINNTIIDTIIWDKK